MLVILQKVPFKIVFYVLLLPFFINVFYTPQLHSANIFLLPEIQSHDYLEHTLRYQDLGP